MSVMHRKMIPAEVEITKARGRYTAQIGDLTASAATAIDACVALGAALPAWCEYQHRSYYLRDLCDPDTVWALRWFGGALWSYHIVHFRPRADGIPVVTCPAGGTTYDTADDAIEALQQHWYSNNVLPIVQGILALCTDRRQLVCPACHGVTDVRLNDPNGVRCGNPACGQPYPGA